MSQDRVPPGQRVTTRFPVLHEGTVPPFDPTTWDLAVDGAVKKVLRVTWEEFKSLPSVTVMSDFHCVTGWSRFDNKWEGVRFSTIANMCEPYQNAISVLVTADGGYTTSLLSKDMLDDDVLLAYRFNGAPLEPEHGGPLRLVVPKKYAYKSAKWVRKITFMTEHELGYWEARGY
ncbi:MAG: molybdopterin-dependent oxidoreductase, partial [Methanomassiliicoccales archaeon]|nr:molybdopterin-dependent oxidoreductase [Methanomassiliicoccales archaeon]